jgi:hypothetical protein
VDYTRDGDTIWSLTSPEYTCASWTEGFATFIGDVSRVWWSAVNPVTCFGSTCTFSLETPNPAVCGQNQGRWAISVAQFLWDAYDNANDGESIQEGFGALVGSNPLWVIGTANRQRDEPFDGTGPVAKLVDREGHNAYDFRLNYFNGGGASLAAAYTNTCGCTTTN